MITKAIYDEFRSAKLHFGCTRLSSPSAIRVGVLVALILAWIACSLAPDSLGAQGANEYEVKAAFLYKFAIFVDWPSDAFGSDPKELIVGLLTDDALGRTIDGTINGKTANGRTIIVRHLRPTDNPAPCQMLFVSATEQSHLPQMLGKLRGASVLIVGEVPRFNQRGGMINFVKDGDKLRFEINQVAAEAARLKISSKLLQLGKPH